MYLLLLTAMALAASGEYVTLISHCSRRNQPSRWERPLRESLQAALTTFTLAQIDVARRVVDPLKQTAVSLLVTDYNTNAKDNVYTG